MSDDTRVPNVGTTATFEPFTVDAPASAGGSKTEQRANVLGEIHDAAKRLFRGLTDAGRVEQPQMKECDLTEWFYRDVNTVMERVVAATEARVRAEERGKILDTTDSGAVGSCMNCGKPDSTEEIVTPFIAAERERVWRLAKDCLSENDNWNMPVLIGAALADGVDLTSLAKPE